MAAARSSGSTGKAEIYRLAVKLEEESYRFYEELLNATPDRGIQNEVRFLRDEEVQHKAFFEELLQAAGPADEAPRGLDLKKAEQEFLLPMKQQRDAKTLASRSEALRLGSQFERGAIQFYEQIKKGETDAEVIRGLDDVLEEEKRHLKKLNVILAY